MKILFCILAAVLACGNPARLLTTKAQEQSIASLSDIGEGELFTMDYKADYKLREFINADLTSRSEVSAAAARLLLDASKAQKVEPLQPACSAFKAVTPDGDVICGRNFDYNFIDAANIMMRTSPKKAYKSLSMVSMNFVGLNGKALSDGKTDLSMLAAAPLMQMDGMNDKGLTVSVLALVWNDCAKQYEKGKHSIMTSVMMRMLLDEASSVDEAVEMLSNYNFFADGEQKDRKKGNFSNYHFFLADATGKSVVIEYIKRDGPESDSPWVMNVLEENSVTNHFLSDGWRHIGSLDDRLGKIRGTLEAKGGVLTEEEAMKLLSDVHQEAKEKGKSKTQWSVVYNLTKKTASVCIGHNYGKIYKFELNSHKKFTAQTCPGDFCSGIRPPATPLFTIDPYFSVWTKNDKLTGDVTRHWTGWKQPIVGAVRVDGKTYRVLGSDESDPSVTPGNPAAKPQNRPQPDENYTILPEIRFENEAEQISSNVLPTRTIYTMRCGSVDIDLTFTSPLVLDDVEMLSRPVSYFSWKASSRDSQKHDVQLYLEVSPRIAMDLNMVPMNLESGIADGISYACTGTAEQNVLGKRGDDIRIDWGRFYLGSSDNNSPAVVNISDARAAFINGNPSKDLGSVRSDNFVSDNLALCWRKDLGEVGRNATEATVMLAYDDIYSIKYLKEHNLRPWWNRTGDRSITAVMASENYESVAAKCKEFDSRVTSDAFKAGGQKHADLCALAYRQCISAHKLVAGPEGQMFLMSKENFSNGCCGTVDVTYPSMPLFLVYNTEMARALIDFIYDYAESDRWDKGWAPHDVGVYPDAYGQHYGNWMPLEESGNLILLSAAICHAEGSAEYAGEHWQALTRWALYCVEHGQMPENQLCTDDFAGKLAHNVNLSAKSILAVAAYADLASKLGKSDEAAAFRAKARDMAVIWKQQAAEEDHYRLAFDAEGTWSMKYNLVWDKALGLNIFDEDIIPTELKYYRTVAQKWGVPLDCRKLYTKTDWELWTGAMSETKEDFEWYVDKVWHSYNDSPDRWPLCDWVDTDAPTIHTMLARSVVGGFWMRQFILEK